MEIQSSEVFAEMIIIKSVKLCRFPVRQLRMLISSLIFISFKIVRNFNKPMRLRLLRSVNASLTLPVLSAKCIVMTLSCDAGSNYAIVEATESQKVTLHFWPHRHRIPKFTDKLDNKFAIKRRANLTSDASLIVKYYVHFTFAP